MKLACEGCDWVSEAETADRPRRDDDPRRASAREPVPPPCRLWVGHRGRVRRRAQRRDADARRARAREPARGQESRQDPADPPTWGIHVEQMIAEQN